MFDMVRENMDLKNHFKHLARAIVAIYLLTSGGVSNAQAIETTAVEPSVEKSLVPVDCSHLYAAVKKPPFTIPQGSWFWQEARKYLARLGLPNDEQHIRKFEKAFAAVYIKIGDDNLDHGAVYDMTPVFQKAGFGNVALGGVSNAQAIETTAVKPSVEKSVEPSVEKNLVPVNCSQLYAAVKKRPFTIPQGSWFWQEARKYLARLGLPHDQQHIKMFEEAFAAVYTKIDGGNFDYNAAYYDMSPVFQKEGLGDVAFDYCSSS